MSANPASSLSSVPTSLLGASRQAAIADVEAELLRAVRETHFGTVEVVIHQSRIVQITRSEKVRFDR
ncbi:MAG TPA: YezD family protein [Thermomonas sp.]|nr:YezD family protein [Thermomonas sp.]